MTTLYLVEMKNEDDFYFLKAYCESNGFETYLDKPTMFPAEKILSVDDCCAGFCGSKLKDRNSIIKMLLNSAKKLGWDGYLYDC